MTISTKPHTIHPTTIYRAGQLQAAFGLKASTLRREIRLGRLRVSKRAGAYFFLGEWILQWLEAGEVSRQAPPGEASAGQSDSTPARRNGRAAQ